MINERDIPSIQCKIGLRGPKSRRKVDGLSLIFVDFYIPALISRLNSTETSLQLSELFQSQSYITTDCQSDSLSWCQAPIWVPR
jgi:hypothetical protein